jgi:hypothetical protein
VGLPNRELFLRFRNSVAEDLFGFGGHGAGVDQGNAIWI